MGAGKAFSSPIIRSQSFSDLVPLDCECPKYFSSFFPPLSEMGKRRLEVCVSLTPAWLCSSETIG